VYFVNVNDASNDSLTSLKDVNAGLDGLEFIAPDEVEIVPADLLGNSVVTEYVWTNIQALSRLPVSVNKYVPSTNGFRNSLKIMIYDK